MFNYTGITSRSVSLFRPIVPIFRCLVWLFSSSQVNLLFLFPSESNPRFDIRVRLDTIVRFPCIYAWTMGTNRLQMNKNICQQLIMPIIDAIIKTIRRIISYFLCISLFFFSTFVYRRNYYFSFSLMTQLVTFVLALLNES